jgi:hypothetical protein
MLAMSRAGDAAQKLDQYIAELRWTGRMKQFTKSYKARRLAARARGEGFLSYRVAQQRLRAALIPLLMNGGKPAAGATLFEQVFRDA